ncbi:MAG: glycosyltransferase involved in cell wall biosynthesis [Planctomycetota bacterium]|jgi:glycosyltransferase involved in cell wall biosynthesis
MTLAVLLPCRNEARVIERRIANLAWLEWPSVPAGRKHKLIVIDDDSQDDTAAMATEALRQSFTEDGPVSWEVTSNQQRPGKAGAISQALTQVAAVDLIVLGDADVLFSQGCLLRVIEAFQADPMLAMACGRQRFVPSLPQDGRCNQLLPEGDGAAAGLYDRITARVRSIESRMGLLFSVHGQCMAWRQSLNLQPTGELAADDLDLALQLRSRSRSEGPWKVCMLAGVHFFECKTVDAEIAQQQALRRARAYVQVMRASRTSQGSILSRLQWSLYRSLPLYAPELFFLLIMLVLGLADWQFGYGSLLLMPLGILLLAGTATGRGIMRINGLIRKARRAERKETLAPQWEMRRT